jgi:hypothetical protein
VRDITVEAITARSAPTSIVTPASAGSGAGIDGLASDIAHSGWSSAATVRMRSSNGRSATRHKRASRSA